MAETDDRFARFSRRRFLKAGTFFALMPSSHLPAYSEAIAPASQDSGSKRPPNAEKPAAPGWMRDLIFCWMSASNARICGKRIRRNAAAADWNELNQAEHRDMLTDVKKMMVIRKEHSTVLAMSLVGRVPNLKAIPQEADIEVPVSYVRRDDRAAIVIVANRNKTRDAHLTLNVVLTDIGLGERKSRCTAKRDGVSGGGLCVFKIEPASLNS